MKKKLFITSLLLASVFMTSTIAQISVGAGKNLTIKNGATLNVKGLVLKPTTDQVITGNSITNSSVAVGSSFSKVHALANPLSSYSGKIIFNYLDTEMIGTTSHSGLHLRVQSALNGTWSSLSDQDSDNNTVTRTFANTDIKSVTASTADATLSVESLTKSADLKVYPNPVVSEINISSNENIEATIFNQLGQPVFTTQEKSIDLSSYSKGVYILKVRNLNDNTINNFKILKQ
jgi:hypothetical protein